MDRFDHNILNIVSLSSRLPIVQQSNTEILTDATATINQLKSVVHTFVIERSWESFHSPKNLAMSIAIEAAELMEHFQWTNPDIPKLPIKNNAPVAQELADVFAYTLRLAAVLGIDLSEALQSKMESNRIKYPVGAPYTPKDISTTE